MGAAPDRWRRTGRRFRTADRRAGVGASRAAPTAVRGRSSGRYGPRPGTRSRSSCLSADRRDERSASRRNFFKSRHGLLVLGRVARTRTEVREAELLQDLADRALVVGDAEALGHDLLQVDPAPAHDPVHGTVRAGLDELAKLRQLLRRQARRMAFRPAVFEPFGAAFVEAVHPVAQGLAVHAADPGRRDPPQLSGRKICPHLHRCRHGPNLPAPWNQLMMERGIANESERTAVGIILLFACAAALAHEPNLLVAWEVLMRAFS